MILVLIHLRFFRSFFPRWLLLFHFFFFNIRRFCCNCSIFYLSYIRDLWAFILSINIFLWSVIRNIRAFIFFVIWFLSFFLKNILHYLLRFFFRFQRLNNFLYIIIVNSLSVIISNSAENILILLFILTLEILKISFQHIFNIFHIRLGLDIIITSFRGKTASSA